MFNSTDSTVFFRFLKIPTSSSSIVRDLDQSFGIRTNQLEFVPVDRNSDQSRKFGPIIRSFVVLRSSFVRRFSASNTCTFLTALHTRTSTSEQHCSSSILKVFLNIPDSKIPWNGITVGYSRFPLAEH